MRLGKEGNLGRHFSSHALSVWQEWLQITVLDSLPHPCSTPLRKCNAFWVGGFGRRYWLKAAQSLLSSSWELKFCCSSGSGPGAPVLPADGGTAVCMSLTLDLTSGGSFAHGHKIHSQRHLFLDGGDILVFIFFSPLSYSQLIQNLGKRRLLIWPPSWVLMIIILILQMKLRKRLRSFLQKKIA